MTQPPPPATAPHGKSVLTRLVRQTLLIVKAHIVDDLTNLNNFRILAGSPPIVSGMLSGVGAIRHRDQAATNNFKVTARVGAMNSGKTWLVTCASPGFDNFYALEIESSFNIAVYHIVKGNGVTFTPSAGILGLLTGLMQWWLMSLEIVSELLLNLIRTGTWDTTLDVNDTVTIWYDESTSTVRGYKNDTEVATLAVPPHEIQHADGYRYWGAVQGISAFPNTGAQFTSIEAQDV